MIKNTAKFKPSMLDSLDAEIKKPPLNTLISSFSFEGYLSVKSNIYFISTWKCAPYGQTK